MSLLPILILKNRLRKNGDVGIFSGLHPELAEIIFEMIENEFFQIECYKSFIRTNESYFEMAPSEYDSEYLHQRVIPEFKVFFNLGFKAWTPVSPKDNFFSLALKAYGFYRKNPKILQSALIAGEEIEAVFNLMMEHQGEKVLPSILDEVKDFVNSKDIEYGPLYAIIFRLLCKHLKKEPREIFPEWEKIQPLPREKKISRKVLLSRLKFD